MATHHDRIRAYYAAFDEWARLDSPEGKPEFEAACGLLQRYLAADSLVLDLGGGPGRYTAELARWGHRVVLADLSADLLERARERLSSLDCADRVESIDEVNAEDLGRYDTARFDAVVAFGPFYHLTARDERLRAASEMARVTAAGGLVFVAFIPLLSGLTGLIARGALLPEQVPPQAFRETARTGVFRNASDGGFQEGYFATPEEMKGLFEDNGFEQIDIVSLRSITYGLEKPMAQLSDVLLAQVRETAAQLSRSPEVLATSGHAVMICRRAS